MRLFLMAASLVAGLGSPAVTAPLSDKSPPAKPAEQSLALVLAQANYPRWMFPAFQANFAAESEKGIVQSGRFARIEKTFPGFTHRYSQAAVVEIRSGIQARLPKLYSQIAEIYEAELNPAEQQQYLDFINSAAGQLLQKTFASHQDVAALTASVAREGHLSQQAADQQMTIAAMTAGEGISDADRTAIRAFLDSPMGAKAVAVDEKAERVILEWSNSPDPEQIKRLNALALKIAKDIARKR